MHEFWWCRVGGLECRYLAFFFFSRANQLPLSSAHLTIFLHFKSSCLSLFLPQLSSLKVLFLSITFGFITNAHNYHHNERAHAACVGVAAAVRITWRMVNMMAKKAGPWPRPPRPAGLERPWAGLAELHKSALHVHTVASPSSMHFSEPCIQQARNRTTPLTTCLMHPLLLIRSVHSSHCLLPSEVSTGLGLT